MAASYPNTVKVWSVNDAGFNYPEDLKEIVYARHVTQLYDEVTAIQSELGAGSGGLKASSFSSTSPVFNPTPSSMWPSLRDRLANIERGITFTLNNRVNIAGGSTVTPSAVGVTGLTLKAISGQTSRLLEVKNSGDTVVAGITPSGYITGVIDGGTSA
jgi:hypothetical protein